MLSAQVTANIVDLEFQAEHTKLVSSIAFSPDRKYATTGSYDRTIKLWDLRSKKLMKTFRGHKREVAMVKFSKDGRYLYSGETGPVQGPIYSLKKWDYLTGTEVYSKDKMAGMIKDIHVSPDDKYLLVEIGSILWTTYEIRDANTGKVNTLLTKQLKKYARLEGINLFKQVKNLINQSGGLDPEAGSKGQFLWGNDSKTLAFYDKNEVVIWFFDKRTPKAKKIKPKGKISYFAFGPDGTALTGGFNGELERWRFVSDDNKAKLIQSIKQHKNPIIAIHYDKTHEFIIVRSNDGQTSLWDKNGNFRTTFPAHKAINIYESFTHDANVFLSAGTDGKVTVWDRTNGKIRTIDTGGRPITKLIPNYYSSDSLLTTYTYGRKKPLQFWNLKEEGVLDLKKNKKRKAKLKNREKGNKYKIKAKVKTNKKSKVKSSPDAEKMRLRVGEYHFFNKTIPFAIHPKGESIASIGEDGITIRSLKSKKIIAQVGKGDKLFINLTYSPNGKEIYAFDLNGNLTAWQINNGNQLASTPLVKATNWVTAFNSQLAGNQIATADKEGFVKFWDIEKGRLINAYKGHNSSVNCIDYHPNNQWIATASVNGQVKVWQSQSGKLVDNLLNINHGYPVLDMKFHPTEPYIVSSDKNKIMAWDVLNRKKPLWQLKTYLPIQSIDIYPKRNLIGGVTDVGTFNIWKFKKSYFLRKKLKNKGTIGNINNITIPIFVPPLKLGNLHITRKMTKGASEIQVAPYNQESWLQQIIGYRRTFFAENNSALINGKLVFSSKGISQYRIKESSLLSNFFYKNFQGHHTDEITSLDLSPDGKCLVSGSKDSDIKIWNIAQSKEIKTLQGHIAPITAVKFSQDGRYIFSADEDNRVKIWDTVQTTPIATIISRTPEDYIIYTPDNYYLSSKGSASDIHFIWNDTSVYYFEQFDLKYNRRDIVLERIGLATPDLIEAYRNAYQKRLSKMGFTEEKLGLDYHAPSLSILNAPEIPELTKSRNIEFAFSALDTLHDLERLHVYVNDVPIFGKAGKELTGKKSQSIHTKINFPLGVGKNKVQLSVLNAAGAESLKETFNVIYEPENVNLTQTNPTLYLITIGAEKFDNPKLDLGYPLKDLRNFIAAYQKHSEYYKNIVVDSLHNNEVSPENLQKIKAKLRRSEVDDQIILFVAGHGVMDAELNYYFAPSNMDFENPVANGIPYEALEDLLDGIPARQKLFLMDACHSGEIDKENVQVIQNDLKKEENVTFRSFENAPRPKHLGLENSFELMKQLFVDLRRGTGATVISSASGVEFAWEGDQWDNSVFTYCLLSGLQEGKADANRDGQIVISELRDYLRTEVPKRTGNHQRPTMRVENISNDWRVW